MRIISVNVARPVLVARGGRTYSTAINKQPVTGAVRLQTENLDGDRQADLRYHGGPDKALCCYCHEHYAHWSERLGTVLEPGAFGENLTIEGMLEEAVCIGDRFRIGREVEVQISQPRQPCFKLANKHSTPALVRWINEHGSTGFYLRVLQTGEVAAGDEITLLDRPHPELTVKHVYHNVVVSKQPDTALLRRLATLEALSQAWREQVAERLQTLGEV